MLETDAACDWLAVRVAVALAVPEGEGEGEAAVVPLPALLRVAEIDGLDVSDTEAPTLLLRLLEIVAVLETDAACDWLALVVAVALAVTEGEREGEAAVVPLPVLLEVADVDRLDDCD